MGSLSNNILFKGAKNSSLAFTPNEPNLGDAKLIKVEILFVITVLFFIWEIFNPESCYVYSLSNPNIIV